MVKKVMSFVHEGAWVLYAVERALLDRLARDQPMRPGRFGDTGPELVGREISFATGRPGHGSSPITLDNLGRTLLDWVGHPAPETLGHDGRGLELYFS